MTVHGRGISHVIGSVFRGACVRDASIGGSGGG